MFENPSCTACVLHTSAKHRCLPGFGRVTTGARMLVLIDHPTYVEDRSNKPMSSPGIQLVKWMFQRMGITPEQYYLEYVVKCYPHQGAMPSKKHERAACIDACAAYRNTTLQIGAMSSVVGLGRLACETLVGSSELPKYEGTFWPTTDSVVGMFSPAVWLGVNVNYVLMNPGVAGELYRVLWAAAVAANYEPKLAAIKPFDWSEFIK